MREVADCNPNEPALRASNDSVPRGSNSVLPVPAPRQLGESGVARWIRKNLACIRCAAHFERAQLRSRFRSSRTRGDSCTRSTRPSLSHLRPQQILRQLPKTMMTQHAIRGLSGATALPRLRTSHASLRGVKSAVAPARGLVSRRGRANTVVVKGKPSLSEPTNPRPLPGADTVSPSMECSCPPRHFDDRPKLTTSLPDLPLDTQPRRPTGAASFPPRSFASARVC